jgi:hypothetical protein
MSFNSKYSGQQVENLLDQVANGNAGGGGSGGITTELDPIFSASAAAKITEENISSWNNKVDKVDGKQLSTEDFTTALKNKLGGLNNYDDTEIQEAVSKLRIDLDTLVSGDTTTAIKTFNEVIAFLDGLEDTEDLASIIASIGQQIATKQDTIEDLATIREGAALGATALQEEQYKGTVTSVTAGDGLAGGTITGSGTIALESLVSAKELGIHPQSTIYTIGIPSGVNYSRTNTAFSNYAKKINIDKHGRISSMTTQTMTIANIVFDFATDTKGGFMSAADKTKLDGIDMTKKQDKLVSGTNIKTINGTSILGSGNIVISGGGSSSGGSGAYAEVNHGTSDTTFELTPNTFHVWDEVASLDLSFADETAGVANEYLFQFTSGATATTLTLPDGLKWANDSMPTIAENMIYQISVLKGLASVLEFKVNLQLIENLITVTLNGMNINASSQYPVMSDIIITTNSGLVTIANGDSNGTSIIDMPTQTFEVLQIMPSSDNTYAYIY